MKSLIAASVLATIANAVSFSAWNGLDCRGAVVERDRGTTPYACYYIGSSASFEGHGLDSNGHSEYRLFKDTACNEQVSVVKYGELCENINFLSVMFVPPITGQSAVAQLSGPSLLDPLDRMQQEMMLLADGHMAVGETLEQWWEASHNSSLINKRAPGDRHNYKSIGIYTIEEVDDNTSLTSDFEFPNPSTRQAWSTTVIRRLTNELTNNQGVTEYNGAQEVNGRSLQIDIRADQGTLNSIPQNQLIGILALFLRWRNAAGHQVWQYFDYNGNRQLVSLSFKALNH